MSTGDQLDTITAAEAYSNQLLLLGIFFALIHNVMSPNVLQIRREGYDAWDLWQPYFTRQTLIP